jgi:hypothetical protein
MRLHVEEEARHVGYAQLELRRMVPAMSDTGRQALARVLPDVLAISTRQMVFPSFWQADHDRIPKDDPRAGLWDEPKKRRAAAAA